MTRARLLAWTRVVAFVALTIAALASCKSKKANTAGIDPESEKRPRSSSARMDAGARAPTGPRAFFLTRLPDHVIGPFWARHGDHVLVAFVTTVEHVGHVIDVMPLSALGEPLADAKAAAAAAPDTNSLVVRPLGGENGGFILGWTELSDRGEVLHTLAVADDGTPRGTPTELARTMNDVVWFDFVPTQSGVVCVWAEQGASGDAAVLAAAIDAQGGISAAPSNVARGVRMWQVAPTDGGVALALATSVGELSWVVLDSRGKPTREARTIVPAGSVSGDVELAPMADGWAFAWTDRSKDEPAVGIALTDAAGNTRAKGRIEGRAGASLAGLVSGAAGVAVAWDDAEHRTRDRRRVYVARISPGARVSGRPLALDVVGRGAPELAATHSGFAALYDGRVCENETDACASAPTTPAFVRTSADLSIVDSVSPALGEVAAQLAWGLSCFGDTCTLLAAAGRAPSDVAAVSIAAHGDSQQVTDTQPSALPEGPRLTAVTQITQGDSIADIAAIPAGDGALVAVLTSVVEDPAKPQRGANLSVRALDAKGDVVGTPATISTRALSVGGVALSPAEKADDGALLAWVARENGDPEVHVTRIDKHGRRTNDVQLTTTKGDAADVALARVAGGWIVAWVDSRNGNGEVYATKVAPDLTRIAREERITNAPGDASDVVLLPGAKDTVWLAWADPRDNVADGFADIYMAGLHARDAKRATDETRVLATTAHSRSPSLVETARGVAVAWIEQAPIGSDANSASPFLGAMVAEVDENAKVVRAATHLRAAGDGVAESIALVAGPHGEARAVVARSGPVAMSLDAMVLGPDLVATRVWELGALLGPPSMDVSLAPFQGSLFFSDDGEGAHERGVRRANVPWIP